jgi:hypothetical protein
MDTFFVEGEEVIGISDISIIPVYFEPEEKGDYSIKKP